MLLFLLIRTLATAQAGIPYDSLRVAPHPSLPPVMLLFSAPERERAGVAMSVRNGSQIRQVLEIEESSDWGCQGEPSRCITQRDVNFDGYMDLQLFLGSENRDGRWAFYLYDPARGIFVDDTTLHGAVGDIVVDSARKEIVFIWWSETGSRAGSTVYRWNGTGYESVTPVVAPSTGRDRARRGTQRRRL